MQNVAAGLQGIFVDKVARQLRSYTLRLGTIILNESVGEIGQFFAGHI